MNHQDDLELEYKAASNEQPSELTDQLILKAAASALEAKQPSRSKVIKGRFASRRWHTPVSIAAAALITVSIVSSLKPWSITVPESSPDLIVSVEQESEKKPAQQKISKDISQTSMLRAPTAMPLRQEIQPPKVSTITDNESLNNTEQIDRNRLQETTATFSSYLGKTEANSAALKKKEISHTIVQWFDVIDKNITDNEVKLGEENIVLLLKQHPLSSFSEQQLIRLEKIRDHLKLPELEQ